MSSAVQSYDPKADKLLTVTDAATHKIWELMQEEDNLELCLRVFISGGGCSGFQYGFTFDETLKETDHIIENNVEPSMPRANDQNQMVRVLIDPMSLQYLIGATIDYVEDLEGSRFVISNPNAQTTCGCGSSFSI